MIDCHAHLADEAFAADLDRIVSDAKDAGVIACVVVAENHNEFQRVLDICENHVGFLYPCFGLHPAQPIRDETNQVIGSRSTDALNDGLDEVLISIRLHRDRLVGVGEVGLDFSPRICSRGETDKVSQREALTKQALVALECELPLNVHSRSAGKPTLNLLKEIGVNSAVLHAFDGNDKSARIGIKQGYYFSVPPSIVRSDQKSKLVLNTPLTQLLLESDSPALGPVKDGRNEPKNVKLSCEYIAKLKGLTVDQVAQATTENALRLFPKLKSIVKN